MAAILEARGLRKRFGAVVAADNYDVRIEADTVVGLIGSNGAGKTTFVNMITGYLKPDAGSILFEGSDITRLKPRQVTQIGICRSFQIPQLYDSMTVRENLGIGFGILRLQRSARPAAAAQDMLARFDLLAHADRRASELPEGVRKLLDIAMALIARPRVLLLDEPTSGVSADEKFGIMNRVMQGGRDQGTTVLFVEHDMEIVRRYAQRVLAFYEGRVLADGSADSVMDDPEVRLHVTGM